MLDNYGARAAVGGHRLFAFCSKVSYDQSQRMLSFHSVAMYKEGSLGSKTHYWRFCDHKGFDCGVVNGLAIS